jgi:hypothetical protein
MSFNMYEGVGLSPLERLIGNPVSSICFVQDYVQIVFDDLVLTCYQMPTVSISDHEADPHCAVYKDRLCGLIGRSVQSVVEKPYEELAIYFDGGDWIRISLRPEHASSVEAATLHQQGGPIFIVWRYD